MTHLLVDALLALDGVDLSGHSNQIQVDLDRTDHDATVFGAGHKLHQAGMLNFAANGAGFFHADTEVTSLVPGTHSRDFIMAPERQSGAICFVSGVEILTGQVGGAVDSLAPWSASFASDGRVHRGNVAYYGTLDGTDAGIGMQLGALASGEAMVATIHCFDVQDELNVEVQSHTSNGWSSPTSEDDIDITVPGVYQITVPGVVARTWWRIALDSGTDPASFLVTLHRTP